MAFDFSKIESFADSKKEEAITVESNENKKTKRASKPNDVNFNINEKDRMVTVNEITNKISKIIDQLNTSYIERENEITMLFLALISSTNAFLHGPAGTGKSQLTEDISRKISGSNYFRILMGKTTEPSEIFGPVSLLAMKNDSYKINTENKLPTAQIAFVDEVFKANSAILNSLLTIMNEKLFFNDEVEEVPLISMIGASNEYIEEDNLLALYDRFLLRWHVDYIQEAGKRVNLFKSFLDSRKSKSKLISKAEVAATKVEETTITIDELLFLNELCKEVEIPLKVLKVYNTLFITLEKKGIIISDRRKNEGLKIIQATALLGNKNTAGAEDLENLKYVLWNEPKDLPTVLQEVSLISNPEKLKYDGYLKSFTDLKKDLEKIEADKSDKDYHFNKTMKITEVNKQLSHVINEVNKILSKMNRGNNNYMKYFNLKNEIGSFIDGLVNEIM